MINRVLRVGAQGDDVVMWQNFLIGFCDVKGLDHKNIVVDGDFGEKTETATKVFQSAKGIDPVTGVVDRETMIAAMQEGIGILEDNPSVIDKTNPAWPSCPSGLEPLSVDDKMRLFGTFSYRPAPVTGCPEAIAITNAKDFTITWVEIPQLAKLPGAPPNQKVQFNAKCSEQLAALFKEWDDAGLINRVLSWAGSYVPRFVRGSRSTLSSHAWGTAFDINAQWNGLGMQPALVGKTGSVRELVEIAAQHGFVWGGWFPNRPDGMHFEVCKIQ